MTIEQDVIEIIADQLGADKNEVTLDKSLVADLNADSLDLTEVIMTLEEKFGCEIAQEEAEQLKTVGDIVKFISARKK